MPRALLHILEDPDDGTQHIIKTDKQCSRWEQNWKKELRACNESLRAALKAKDEHPDNPAIQTRIDDLFTKVGIYESFLKDVQDNRKMYAEKCPQAILTVYDYEEPSQAEWMLIKRDSRVQNDKGPATMDEEKMQDLIMEKVLPGSKNWMKTAQYDHVYDQVKSTMFPSAGDIDRLA